MTQTEVSFCANDFSQILFSLSEEESTELIFRLNRTTVVAGLTKKLAWTTTLLHSQG